MIVYILYILYMFILHISIYIFYRIIRSPEIVCHFMSFSRDMRFIIYIFF